MRKLVETVPNISEGRRPEVVSALSDILREAPGVKLLDVSRDADHNRTVVTAVGEPEALVEALFQFYCKAIALIDLNQHQGEHPRLGAVDVCPFVPISGVTMEECAELAHGLGRRVAESLELPVFLYARAASAPHREKLADIRRGEFEGLADKLKLPEWAPDFGPHAPHPTAGATVIGARPFLIAYNINLNTSDLKVAKAVAKAVRASSGGLQNVQGLGLTLADRNQVQVSMNLLDFQKTPLHRVYQLVQSEAERYGAQIVGSEIVGLLPQEALLEAAAHFLRVENWDSQLVLENRMNG